MRQKANKGPGQGSSVKSHGRRKLETGRQVKVLEALQHPACEAQNNQPKVWCKATKGTSQQQGTSQCLLRGAPDRKPTADSPL